MIFKRNFMNRGALLAGATTCGLVAGALIATAPAFGIGSITVTDDFGPGDGLSRYVVALSPGASASDLAASPVIKTLTPLDENTAVVSSTATRSQVAALAGVVSAAPSAAGTVDSAAASSDPLRSAYGWNLLNTGSNAHGQAARPGSDTGATKAWPATRGAGAVVAVIDTGYDSDHPDLAGALWTNPKEACGAGDADANGLAGDCHGWNFAKNTADVDNGAGGAHGTTVAGSIAARQGNGAGSAGIAPSAQIMPLVIGTGQSVDLNLGAVAIRYAVDHGADVVNASWGGAGDASTRARLDAAIAYAASKGVLVVAAAGNDSANRDTSIRYPASSPEPGLVVVGASGADDSIASFSARGATSVDVFAPGVAVVSTYNDGGYRLVNGTSIASPQVAAGIAMARSMDRSADATTLKDRVLAASSPVPAMAGASTSGARLDLSLLSAPAAAGVRWTFSDMLARPGTVTPKVALSSTISRGTYAVELGLAQRVDGRTWAVAGREVTLNGTTVRTDDRGRARFELGSGSFLPDAVLAPTMTLGEGSYALSAQVLLDGAPLARPFAAPLQVSQSAAIPPAGTPTPAGPITAPPGAKTPASAPAKTPANAPAPGKTPTSAPSSPRPAKTPAPASGDAPGTSPGVGAPAPAPSAPGVAPQASAKNPDAGAPGPTPAPGAGPGEGRAPAKNPASAPAPGEAKTPAPQAAPAPSKAPIKAGLPPAPIAPSGRQDYPSVGDLAITSMTPTRVPAAGGTKVVVTGANIPAGAKVRLGLSTVAATVSGNQVTFTTPARPAGTIDVTLYASGRSSTLDKALTFYAADGSVPPPSPGPAPVVAPAPKASAPVPSAPKATPAPVVQPSQTTDPDGGRLVFDPELSAALEGVWTTTCATTCSGVQV